MQQIINKQLTGQIIHLDNFEYDGNKIVMGITQRPKTSTKLWILCRENKNTALKDGFIFRRYEDTQFGHSGVHFDAKDCIDAALNADEYLTIYAFASLKETITFLKQNGFID